MMSGKLDFLHNMSGLYQTIALAFPALNKILSLYKACSRVSFNKVLWNKKEAMKLHTRNINAQSQSVYLLS